LSASAAIETEPFALIQFANLVLRIVPDGVHSIVGATSKLLNLLDDKLLEFNELKKVSFICFNAAVREANPIAVKHERNILQQNMVMETRFFIFRKKQFLCIRENHT
jgi:hypothetical protein